MAMILTGLVVGSITGIFAPPLVRVFRAPKGVRGVRKPRSLLQD